MHQFKLIDSNYTASEAREILMAIINSKIQFHQLKTFSHDIRYGIPDAHSEKRIKELEETRRAITQFLQEHQHSDITFDVASTLTIKVTSKEPNEYQPAD
ncbi:MAG TPA: hypothetical protein VIN07_03695 [Flavipsychrobacter sp.]